MVRKSHQDIGISPLSFDMCLFFSNSYRFFVWRERNGCCYWFLFLLLSPLSHHTVFVLKSKIESTCGRLQTPTKVFLAIHTHIYTHTHTSNHMAVKIKGIQLPVTATLLRYGGSSFCSEMPNQKREREREIFNQREDIV